MISRDQIVSASEDLLWNFGHDHRLKSIFDVHRSKTSLLKLTIIGFSIVGLFSIDCFCCPFRKKLLSPQSLPQRRHMHRDWWVLYVRMCTGIQRKELRKWVSKESVNSFQCCAFLLFSLTVLKANLLCLLCSSPLGRAVAKILSCRVYESISRRIEPNWIGSTFLSFFPLKGAGGSCS